MVSTLRNIPGGIPSSKNLTEHDYDIGLHYYEKWKADPNRMEKPESINTGAHRLESIRHLEKFIANTPGKEEELAKIHALLLLTELYYDDNENSSKTYFYHAIETAQQYYGGDDFWNTEYGKDITNTYLSIVNSAVKKVFRGSVVEIVRSNILLENENRKQNRKIKQKEKEEEQLRESEEIKRFIKNKQHSSDVVLKKIEDTFGSIKLSIVSDNSGEVLINYSTDESKVDSTETPSDDAQYITVNVFDKPRKYMVDIHRIENKSLYSFEPYQLTNTIYPLIEYFIIRKEREFFNTVSGNINKLEAIESDMMGQRLKENDYHTFVEEIISEYGDVSRIDESQEDISQYTDSISQALDICRCVRLGYKNIPKEINRILGGKSNRKVLNMVKSMLLSCNETMNGFGYPFGLSKKEIPLEGRIYKVIRAYEILMREYKQKKTVVETMREGVQSGYFDSNIFGVFLKNLDQGEILSKSGKNPEKITNISPIRTDTYTRLSQSWLEFLQMTKDIGELYRKGHSEKSSIDEKNKVFKEANELRIELLQKVGTRKLLIITRHGETESDRPNGPPGNEYELLTKEGEETSFEKGKKLSGLRFSLISSPLIRARQTAAIICREVRKCVKFLIPEKIEDSPCMKCPAIISEEIIANPAKNRLNDRYDSLLQKFIADDNFKGLGEFLKKLVSSPEESTKLCITHLDSGRHMIFWLKNIFSQNKISSEKTAIDNDTIYEFLFQGDQIISEEEESTKGILFSYENWKEILFELNALTNEVFGEIFYDPTNRQTDLIDLHDLFLDFMDNKREESPEKFPLFVERLKENPLTKNLIPMLEKQLS